MKKRRSRQGPLAVCLALLLLLALAILAGRAAQLPSPQILLPAASAAPTPSPHVHRFADDSGRCADCGWVCDHACGFDGAHRCIDCGWLCPHSGTHSVETAACPVCGAQFNHRFGTDGVCDLCGAQAELYSSPLPDAFFSPSAHSGRCLTETLTDASGAEHTIAVYLPWDYSEATRYNVVLLIHGDGGSCEDWTDALEHTDRGDIRFCTVYDQIVERHLCDPFVIVGLNNAGMEYPLFGESFIEQTVLPHLARSYSTWMEGDSHEQIAAAREHIAIGGLSRGSIYTYTFAMTRCLDVAANFCCFSNGYTTDVTRALRAEEAEGLGFRSYIASVGLKDDYITVRGHRHCYDTLCRTIDGLTDGENARLFEIDAGHNFLTWTASLYDALLLMF